MVALEFQLPQFIFFNGKLYQNRPGRRRNLPCSRSTSKTLAFGLFNMSCENPLCPHCNLCSLSFFHVLTLLLMPVPHRCTDVSKGESFNSQMIVFRHVAPQCVCVRPKNLLYIYGDDLPHDPSAAVYIISRYFSFYLDRICPLQQLRFHKNFCVLYPPLFFTPSN